MRVLIVSPHFSPANAPDMHRVRTLLPFLGASGVEAEVLAVEAEQTTCPLDRWLEAGLPGDVPVHRARALGLGWTRIPGLGSLGLRARRALVQMGNKLLATRRFDLVYFSTTVFELTTLGLYWKRRFDVPYVIDYQDPWVTTYYRDNLIRPPGGRLKYGVVDWLARRKEPRVLSECSGLTTVSAAYGQQLRNRYACVANLPELVIPFPGATRDFERIASGSTKQSVFDPSDGRIHWVYVGVSGPIMFRTLGALFAAVRAEIASGSAVLKNVTMHFIGTSYAPAGTASDVVKPLAKKYGVSELVREQPDRIPYSEALCCLRDAHALVVPGSDDPAYNASKLLPYLMAKKPMLAIFHRESPTSALINRIGGAAIVTFDDGDGEDTIAGSIRECWFRGEASSAVVPLDELEAEPYFDRGQAKLLVQFFNSILHPARTISV